MIGRISSKYVEILAHYIGGELMKSKYVLLVALILSISLFGAGCVKYKNIYVFSFKAEQDLVNNLGEWIPEDTDYAFNQDGVNISYANLACPLRFSGDMRITVKFWLDVGDGTACWVGLGLSDSTWWCGHEANDVHVDLYDLGSDSEWYRIADHDLTDFWGTEHYSVDDNVPGLVRNGFNYYVMTKTGDEMVAAMNGKVFARFTLANYDSEWFGPNLTSWRYGSGSGIGATFESIMVEYNGEASPMPYDGSPDSVPSSVTMNR